MVRALIKAKSDALVPQQLAVVDVINLGKNGSKSYVNLTLNHFSNKRILFSKKEIPEKIRYSQIVRTFNSY